MVRILGKDIPSNKRVEIALRYLYGLGPTNVYQVLEAVGIDPALKAKELTDEQISQLNDYLSSGKIHVEGELRREVQSNIARLQKIQSYRGMRHRLGLPVRGQRSRSNARTRKGKRKTVAGKKQATAKK